MSNPNDRKVEFNLTAKDNLSGALKEATENMKRMQGALGSLSGAMNTVKVGFASLAALAGLDGLKEKIKSITETGSKIGEFSERTGVAAEDLQKLNFAASQNGSGIDSIGEAISKLNRKLGAARAGDGSSQKFLKNLGIDLSTTKDAKDALLQLADGFKELGDEPEGLQQKAAILKAMKLPADLVATLSQGSDGIKEFGTQLEKMGGIIDNETISQMKDLKDKMDAIEVRSHATSAQLVGGLEPALNKIATAFMDTRGSAAAFKGVGELLGETLLTLITLGTRVVDVFGHVGRALGAGAAAVAIQIRGIVDGEKADVIDAKLAAIADGVSEDKGKSLGFTERLRQNLGGGKTMPDTGAGGGRGGSNPDAVKPGKGRINIAALLDKDKEEASAKVTALAAFEKAQAEAAAGVRVAEEKRAQDLIKQQLDDGTISYKDYYAALVAAQQASVDERIKALEKEKQAQEKVINSGNAKESEKLKARGEIAKVEGKIKELTIERGAAAEDAARAQMLAERDLLIELDKVKLKTAEIMGAATPEQRAAAAKEQYRILRQKAQQAGKDTSGIDQAEQLDTAQAVFGDVTRGTDRARTTNTQQLQKIAQAEASGDMNRAEARRARAAANEELRKSIEGSIPALEEQAKILGPEYQQKVDAAKLEIEGLAKATDEVANSINQDLMGGLSAAIYDVGTGSKSPAEALKDLFAGVGSSIAKQVSDDLASDLYKNLKSSGFDLGGMMSNLFSTGSASSGQSSGGGGLGGLLSGAMSLLGFESGGHTGNMPTNEIAGVVHGGEYVLSAPATKRLGVGFLDALHNAARAGAPRSSLTGFANGGFVGAGSGMGRAGGGVTVNQTIISKDAESFRRSQGQIEAQAGTAIQRANKRYA